MGFYNAKAICSVYDCGFRTHKIIFDCEIPGVQRVHNIHTHCMLYCLYIYVIYNRGHIIATADIVKIINALPPSRIPKRNCNGVGKDVLIVTRRRTLIAEDRTTTMNAINLIFILLFRENDVLLYY